MKSPGFKAQFAGYIPNAHPQQVVAIKMITERSAIRPDEQLAFARELNILTQAVMGWIPGNSNIIMGYIIIIY